jgi:hypothetical protein
VRWMVTTANSPKNLTQGAVLGLMCAVDAELCALGRICGGCQRSSGKHPRCARCDARQDKAALRHWEGHQGKQCTRCYDIDLKATRAPVSPHQGEFSRFVSQMCVRCCAVHHRATHIMFNTDDLCACDCVMECCCVMCHQRLPRQRAL